MTLIRSRSINQSLVVLAAVLMCVGGAAAESVPSYRLEIAVVSAETEQALRNLGESTIAVGTFTFTGPAVIPTSGGQAIARILREEFQKVGLKTDPHARHEINGEFKEILDKASRRLALVLHTRVTERATGKVIADTQRGIFGDASHAALLGLTADLNAEDQNKRDEILMDASEKPQVHLQCSRIKTTPTSPFAIEILSLENAQTPGVGLAPKNEKGLAYIPLAPGRLFAIRLFNDSERDAVARVTIDAENVLAISEWASDQLPEPVRCRTVFVPAKSSITLRGWHRAKDQFEPFAAFQIPMKVGKGFSTTSKLSAVTATFGRILPSKSAAVRDARSDGRSPYKSFAATLQEESGKSVMTRKEIPYGTLPNIEAVTTVRFSE